MLQLPSPRSESRIFCLPQCLCLAGHCVKTPRDMACLGAPLLAGGTVTVLWSRCDPRPGATSSTTPQDWRKSWRRRKRGPVLLLLRPESAEQAEVRDPDISIGSIIPSICPYTPHLPCPWPVSPPESCPRPTGQQDHNAMVGSQQDPQTMASRTHRLLFAPSMTQMSVARSQQDSQVRSQLPAGPTGQ